MTRVSRKRKGAKPAPPAQHGPDSIRESAALHRLDWLIALTLAIATLVVFSHTWTFDFTNWDDGAYITNNRNLHDANGLKRIWFSIENEQYYPLTFSTFWLEYQLWGEDPMGYHVVNTVLHALNTVLVVVLGRRLGLSTWMATIVAALFAVHPMQAMTVAWVAERKTLLACLFTLLATLAWLNYLRNQSRATHALAFVFFALALLSKSAILLAPLAWLILAVAIVGMPLRRSLLVILPMLVLAVFSTFVTRYFESEFIDAQALAMIPTPLHRILLAGTAFWWYLLAILVPLRLSPVYPLWNIGPSQPIWWLGLIALAMAVAVTYVWRRHIGGVAVFGKAWLLLMLLPTLGLLAYGNLAVTPVSNHYVYISSVGLLIGVASWLDSWRFQSPTRSRILSAVLGCIILAAVVAVRSEARDFQDSRSLWTAALARAPDCFAAQLGLGQVALGEKDLDAALQHYSAATRIRPEQYEGHAALSEVYIRMQKWPEARSSVDTALNLRPDHVPALLARATLAEHDGDMSTALDLVRRANGIDPGNPRAAVQLGVLLLRVLNSERGGTPNVTTARDTRLAEARSAFDRVIQLRPDDESGYRGAVECDRLRRDWGSAIATARAGLAIAPNSVPLKNLLAITLARCPEERLRDGRAAVRLAEEIAGALGGRNYQLLETLASAYAAAARFPEAARVSREAAQFARDAGNEEAALAHERWAAQYDARQPRLD